jgi:hypothetical protein
MLAHKRVLFLGHGQPANNVARMVLAACAMASGCGQVLRGTTESAFPYANLASLDILEEFGGYVAGVANPRFEELHHTWDVLCDLNTGRVIVSKDLKSAGLGVGGGKKRESDASLGGSIIQVDGDSAPNTPAVKMSSASRADCTDNQFMEEVSLLSPLDVPFLYPSILLHACFSPPRPLPLLKRVTDKQVLSAMSQFQGEASIRLRFTEYIKRFTSLASYQEYSHTGRTKIGFPPTTFRNGQLGTGTVFADDMARQREMRSNGHKIDAWRKTDTYKLYVKVSLLSPFCLVATQKKERRADV